MATIQQTSFDTVLPVQLQTALRHIRALESDADLVAFYLKVATAAVEDYTGRALLTKTYNLLLDAWPQYRGYWPSFRQYLPFESVATWGQSTLRRLELRRTPLVSVQSIQYWDYASGNFLTFPSSNYYVDLTTTPGTIAWNDNAPGFNFPDLLEIPGAVTIGFTAGSGTLESQMDPMLRMAVLAFTKTLFDSRDPVCDGKCMPLPYSLAHMLRAKRVDSLTSVT
jgi:hypothetical protein